MVLKKKVSKGTAVSASDAPGRSAVATEGLPPAKKKPAPRRVAAAKPRGGAATVSPAAGRVRKAAAVADAEALRATMEPTIAALRDDIRGVSALVERLAAPPTRADVAVDAAVDALRRVLSDLIEQRTESLVRELVDIRRDAVGVSAEGGARVVERLDQLLEELGAVRFEAEAMDVVDPLIHVVVEERQQADAPDGVVLETVRPGYRTARGLIVCKAAVVVNQRS
ncbi:MAG: GrpE [Deltaproteobacteria bacterium]|nr:GrpE [Deltaproteobacteria bacterium]